MADKQGEKTLMSKCADSLAIEEPVTRMPLWGSCRLVYTICGFFTMFNLILLRFNLSFALVCMVRDDNRTELDNYTSSSVDCPKFAVSEETTGIEVVGEFEWSKMQQGRILSGFFYGYIVSQGFGGWFSDKFGGKMPFILGNMLQSIITLLLPAASRFHADALFGFRVIQGIVCGLSLPSLFQLFTRWASPAERTALLGIAYSGFPIANVIIFPLSGVLCQYGFDGGWPSIFYITGIFGLSCSIIFCFLVYDDPDTHPRISEKEKRYLKGCTRDSSKKMRVPWKAILTSKPVYAYHIVHFCYSWGFVTLAANLPLFMKEVLYFDLNQNGMLSSLPYLGMLGVRIIISSCFASVQKCTGFSLTRLRKINHTLGTVGAGVCMLLVTVLTCRDQYLAVALIVIGQSVSDLAFTGGYLVTYLDLAPQYAGLLTGISNTIGSVAGVISPTLVGLLTPNGTREEWMIVMYITTAFYFLGAAVYLAFGSSKLQPWADDQNEPQDVTVPEIQNSLLSKK